VTFTKTHNNPKASFIPVTHTRMSVHTVTLMGQHPVTLLYPTQHYEAIKPMRNSSNASLAGSGRIDRVEEKSGF
jgi:hypothetical protein